MFKKARLAWKAWRLLKKLKKENKMGKKWYLSKTNLFGILNIVTAAAAMLYPPLKEWIGSHITELQTMIGATIVLLRSITTGPVKN